jgi:hypothetical protein
VGIIQCDRTIRRGELHSIPLAVEKGMIRVVQWTTGNVGQRAAMAVLANPNLEIVGCYAWSADKAGRDVGDLPLTTARGMVSEG